MAKMKIVATFLGLAAALAVFMWLTGTPFTLGDSRVGASGPRSCVAGPHTGVIAGTQQWCAVDSPHLMTGDVTVPAGMTLTVEPGVIVMGAANVELLVAGQLDALGTPAEPILFTSEVDTGPEQWAGLAFDGGTGHLSHATVRYAGQRNSVSDGVGHWFRASIAMRDVLAGQVLLENTIIRDIATTSQDAGIYVENSHLVLEDSSFTAIGDGSWYQFPDSAIYIAGGESTVELSNNTFDAGDSNTIVLQPGAMMNHDTTLVSQDGLVGYVLENTLTVPPGITLTLDPGVTVKGNQQWNLGAQLWVEGHLEAIGTPAQPVVFTSYWDSGPDQWPGLVFDGGTGHLNHAIVRYAGQRNDVTDVVGSWFRSSIAMRNVQSGEVLVENSTIGDIATTSQDAGIYVEDSHLVLEDSLFTAIGDGSWYQFPDTVMYIAGGDSEVALANNTFDAGDSNTIVMQPGAMMNHDTTLVPQSGLIGYVLQEAVTVPPGITLTLEPGATVRGNLDWNKNAELRIEGTLVAIGTPDQPITFTSFQDSAPSQWPGLVFEGSAGGGNGHLRYVTVRHGGQGNSAMGNYLHGSNIHVQNVTSGEVRLENCTLESVLYWDGWHSGSEHGLCAVDSHVAISNTLITDVGDNGEYERDAAIMVSGESVVLVDGSVLQANGGSGMMIEGDDAFVRVNGSSIVANQRDGVRNMGQSTVILSGDAASGNAVHDNAGYGANQEDTAGQILATYNWWGDATGPTHTDNPSGLGEDVTDWVLYDPWLTEPPAPPLFTEDLVWSVAPTRASPGQTTNLGIYFQNSLTETLTETLVVLELPWESNYLYSTGGGEYWPEKHRVQWKLGDVEPGETFAAAAQIQFKWGIPNDTEMRADANLAAGNLPSPYVAHPEQVGYEAVTVVDEYELSQAEVDSILTADGELSALFDDALAQDYEYFGNATQQTMSDGTERLTLVLIDRDRPGDLVAVRRLDDDERHVRLETPTDISIYTLEGGARFTLATSEWEFWGTFGNRSREASAPAYANEDFWVADWALAACGPLDWGDCVRNCLIENAPRPLQEDLVMGGAKCLACMNCTGDCLDICSDCARDLWNDFHDERYKDCTRNCADSNQRNSAKCDGDKQDCYAAEGMGPYGQAEYRLLYHCNSATCTYDFPPVLEFCPYGCVYGQSGTTGGMNTECEPMPCPDGGPLRDPDCIKALTAHDPNAMYGPLVTVPGETIEYTIECENEGEGTAYAVFIESELPEGLDEGTLQIADGGVYFAGSRTLMWVIGELGPGAGDSVSFSAQVPEGTEIGTILSTQATVHFPSVPETTPTNPVVTIVDEVAAHGQQLETQEGVAFDTSLTGSSPTGNPLTFDIFQHPINGNLTGLLPDQTYTPAANFEGFDSFDFTADDGVNLSVPARVSILVHSGAETIPPRVVFTVPRDGTEGMAIYGTPAYPGTYLPLIWAMFDEPIDASTLSDVSFVVTNAQGLELEGAVAYDGILRVARFLLGEPLLPGQTYTVRLTSDVQDTSGNALVADYVWSFGTRSAAHPIYLPLVLRAP